MISFDSHIIFGGEVRSYISDLQCDLNNESSHSEAIVACTVKIDTPVHAARKLHRTAVEVYQCYFGVDKQKGDRHG